MNQQEALAIFLKHGALRSGHFILYSGKHARQYVDKDRVYAHPLDVFRLCQEIAERVFDQNIEVVVAPEKGGIILSQIIAYYLSQLTGREVLAFYAEKDHKGYVLKRGGVAEAIAGKRVLVADDILTSGESVSKVVQVVRHLRGFVVSVYALFNRRKVTKESVGNPERFGSLIEMEIEDWEICPPELAEVPVDTSVGKGAEFLAAQGAETL